MVASAAIQYDTMIQDCLVGLKLVQTKSPNSKLRAHGYLLFFSDLKQSNFTQAERNTLKAANWWFSKEYGLGFTTVG